MTLKGLIHQAVELGASDKVLETVLNLFRGTEIHGEEVVTKGETIML